MCCLVFQTTVASDLTLFNQTGNGIGNDTLETNWDKPLTVRDKIRVDFKRNNRAYDLFDTLYYSPAIDVIKPLKIGDPVVEWWKKKVASKEPVPQSVN